MPRARNVYHTEFPYHLSARTNNGHHFPCDLTDAWNTYQNALLFCARVFETRILSFVMMSNHFHLLMVTPNGNLSEFMKYFMKRTSDEIRSFRKIENHLYGDRYYPSLVSNQNYYQSVIKYIYQNPIRARLADSVLDYPYSTLPGFLGFEKMIIPTYDDSYFFEDLTGNLNWLDERYHPIEVEQLSYALRQPEFKFKPNSSYYLDDTSFNRPIPTSKS